MTAERKLLLLDRFRASHLIMVGKAANYVRSTLSFNPDVYSITSKMPGAKEITLSTAISEYHQEMRAIFIRHGESTGNAGIPCQDTALLELTEKGWQQATEVASCWTEIPSLIVISPYLRTHQTAAPTIERFPEVSVEVWPIQEFTYLQPGRWNGTLSAERMPAIERYWAEADPEYCDGEGAESFQTLLQRAEAALTRLAAMSGDALVYVFSHGQFIQAVRSLVIDSELSNHEKMRQFWGKGSPAIRNAERMTLRHSSDDQGRFRGFRLASDGSLS